MEVGVVRIPTLPPTTTTPPYKETEKSPKYLSQTQSQFRQKLIKEVEETI